MRWRPLWLLVALGASYGLNQLTKPDALYVLGIGDRTLSTGTLSLRDGARRYDYKLITLRVVAADVPLLLAKPLAVREVWLRSPADEHEQPDLELFADFGQDGPPIDPASRDVRQLRARPIAIAARARGAPLLSRVRLPGAPAPANVVDGQLWITETLELAKGDPSSGYRIRGKLQLSIADGEGSRALEGELNAKLLWY